MEFHGGVKSCPRINRSDFANDLIQDLEPGFLNPIWIMWVTLSCTVAVWSSLCLSSCDLFWLCVSVLSLMIVVVPVVSEEVAFYQGNRKEQAIINTTLHRLVSALYFIICIIPLDFKVNLKFLKLIHIDILLLCLGRGIFGFMPRRWKGWRKLTSLYERFRD